jgi:sugar phosphate isomerase/epimerase
MLTTRTGNFTIGFRRLNFSPWQQSPEAVIEWAKKRGFSFVDLGNNADAPVPGGGGTLASLFLNASLKIGSADLPEWTGMISPDPDRRQSCVDRNAACIKTLAPLGVKNFFIVMIPDNPNAPRKENFAHMIDSLNALSLTLDATDTRLVIEGWPGPGALCCTPETVRATLRSVSSRNVGLNYDPPHLLRKGIDPLRFLEEFADHVYHVHGKDAEILTENLYEYGIEQPPTFGKPRDFGSINWRYCIPGHGNFRWSRGLEILASRNYQGAISIELEDDNFNGSEGGEQRGLTAAGHFLMTC